MKTKTSIHATNDEANLKRDQSTPSSSSDMQSFKLLLLILMVVQNSSFALVGRYTRSSVAAEDLYIVSHVILSQECVKFVVSCVLEHRLSKSSSQGQNLWTSLQQHVFQNPLDALKISIPAFLYLVQTSLLFVALSKIPAPLYQVAFQGKLLTTAIVSVLMLQRKYTLKQWTCLVTLGFGVAIVVLGEQHISSSSTDSMETPSDVDHNSKGGGMGMELSPSSAEVIRDGQQMAQNMLIGLLSVTSACFCSAFAGVYTEKLLKKPLIPGESSKPPASLWMRNIQMAFLSICIATIQILSSEANQRKLDTSPPKSFFHGFTAWVYGLVLIQAVGGLLVAAVMKYADNVLKGLAMGVSVVLSTASSMILFGTPLTSEFVVGATIVLGSVYLFSNDLPQNAFTKMLLHFMWDVRKTILIRPKEEPSLCADDKEPSTPVKSSPVKRRTGSPPLAATNKNDNNV